MKKHYGSALYLVACLLLMMTPTAHAYIDPSVTTFLIQAIGGVAIAVGAVVMIFWRRAKKKVSEKLGIDENAAKETEADVVVYMDGDKPQE